ncbi:MULTISPECIES: hypothetical protein [Priestia]|uniref:Uncharacterized protein n=2 Tax=Priestia TaxID=2800373 RepID=A0A0H4KDU6_9BACI|nr:MULTISPECIES: hypothetical protein [Priestia]AKO91790.1 hypothetical protein BEH_06530 [Priestia filamentosa]KAB2490332.1 hypothetical protein F8155_21185 [Priestia endophytica]MBG9811460.1 hypothetical protein [Priestia endophytica]MCM3537135.1 hypothetical protein [Priestia endophytica]MCY8231092.1 hypothetical protein [Priestia endophytica]
MKLKKRIVIPAVAVVVLVCAAFFIFTRADYHGKVVDISGSKVYLGPLTQDEGYQIIEVTADKDTEFEGGDQGVFGLKKGQEVHVWLKNGELASKISVE